MRDDEALAKLRALLAEQDLSYSKRRILIRAYVRKRAGGRCEHCDELGFETDSDFGNDLYLEAHHLDHNSFNNTPGNIIALCANCHRKVHHHKDRHAIKKAMRAIVERLEKICV
jgi:5-methylcytosine-specific restriction protein A